MSDVPRSCRRVRDRLPELVADELPGWRMRLAQRHLRHCDDCALAATQQRRVALRLEALARTDDATIDTLAPPDDLLATILADVEEPDLRARAAVPVRGAISGARPGLSVALVLAVLALVGAAGWAGWHLGRSVRLRRRGPATDGRRSGASPSAGGAQPGPS